LLLTARMSGGVGDPETRLSGALLYAFVSYAFVSRDHIVGWGFKGEVQGPNLTRRFMTALAITEVVFVEARRGSEQDSNRR